MFLNLPFCTLLQNSHTITVCSHIPAHLPYVFFVCLFCFLTLYPSCKLGAGHNKYNAALFAEWSSLSQMIKMANRFSAQSTMQSVLEEREAFDDDDDDDDVEEEASECEDHISDYDFEEEDEIEYQLAPK